MPPSHDFESEYATNSESKVDVVIVTALNEELEYLITALNLKVQTVSWKHPYYRFELRSAKGRIVQIAAGSFDKMDNTYAGTYTLELLQRTTPELVVNIGISGLVDDELGLGDVVVAENSENATYRGKIKGKERLSEIKQDEVPSFEDFVLGGDVISTYYSFHEVIRQFERTNQAEWLDWINKSLVSIDNALTPDQQQRLSDQGLIRLPPKTHVGSTVTEPWVGASPLLKLWLKNHVNRNLLAMDTESWGVLHGARSYSPDLKTIVFRGISDPADERKKELDNLRDGAIRKWAMFNASHVFALFIEHYWADNYLPDEQTSVTTPNNDEVKRRLEEDIHKTSIRVFLDPYYGNESIIRDHGYDAYGKLFATITNITPTTGTEFLKTTIDVVTSPGNPHPLLIEGMPGTGKTSLLSILYWYIRNRRQETLTVPLPIFINLHRYNETSKGSTRSVNQDVQAVAQMEKDLTPLRDFIKAFPEESLVVIVDGFDDFARFKDATFKYISEVIQEAQHCKIIGSREALEAPWFKTTGNIPATVYQLKAIHVDDPRLGTVLNAFVDIWISPATPTDTKGRLSSRLSEAIREAKIKWIDLFVISLVAESRLRGTPRYAQNLSQLLEDYCRQYLSERLKNFMKPDELLVLAASIAFDSQVERRGFSSKDGDELIIWDLVQKHSRVCDYLTAYHITREFLGLAYKQVFDTDRLRYVYPHRINRLAKDLINRNTKEQIDFAQALDKLLRIKRVQDYAKAQACYLAGRLKDPQAKGIALEALRKFRGRKPRRRTKPNENLDPRDYRYEEQTNDRLLLERTIYISMAYLGDQRSEAEYIDLLFANPRMDLINRGFHLEYYGDQEYDPTKPLTNSDQLRECPKTFNQLIQNLSAGPSDNPIFEIELFTLCSLAQKRHAIHRLQENDRRTIVELLKKIMQTYDIRHNKLQIYVRMLSKHLDRQDFDISDIFSELYSIKDKKRMGWVRRHIDNAESVADHSYGAYLIGLLFLPDHLEGHSEYSKSTILQMLLIHDLAESITGDILPENSSEMSKRREREVYEEIGLLGTYEQFSNMTRVYSLWDEFEDRRTINGKIAKEIDKIENLVQLFLYHQHKPVENFDEWRAELLEIVKTDVGKSIIQRIEQMLE